MHAQIHNAQRSRAFEVTAEDVFYVLSGAARPLAMDEAERLFEAHVAKHAAEGMRIEKAALMADDLDAQTEAAHGEIFCILVEEGVLQYGGPMMFRGNWNPVIRRQMLGEWREVCRGETLRRHDETLDGRGGWMPIPRKLQGRVSDGSLPIRRKYARSADRAATRRVLITKFNTNHVKAVVRHLLGRDCYAHSDGTTMAVNAGPGGQGLRDAERIVLACSFPATIQQSERLGSFADKERWEADGILFDHYVTFVKPEASSSS